MLNDRRRHVAVCWIEDGGPALPFVRSPLATLVRLQFLSCGRPHLSRRGGVLSAPSSVQAVLLYWVLLLSTN